MFVNVIYDAFREKNISTVYGNYTKDAPVTFDGSGCLRIVAKYPPQAPSI